MMISTKMITTMMITTMMITTMMITTMMITSMVILMTRAAGCQVVMVPDSRLADSEKKEATLCLEDLRQIQPEHFGLPAFKYSKVCVFVPQSRPPFHCDVGDPRDL